MPFYYKSHGKEAPNAFVTYARKIYNPLGFNRGYNFPLWIILGGAALGFCLSRAMFLNYDINFREQSWMSGDWEHYRAGFYRIGMLMHLVSVIPIGLLLPWQFLPIVRYKAMIFHRLSGYLLLILLLCGNAGALMIANKALGGAVEVQLVIGILSILTTGSGLLAYINIKRLQIDQHRAWMLRCWAYAFVIITQRIIQNPMVKFMSQVGGFYKVMPCHTIDFVDQLIAPGLATSFYPECAGSPNTAIAVLVDSSPMPTAEGIPPLHQITASIQASFGPTGMLALFIHVFAVEIYLKLTAYEGARLKRVSRERQLKRGWTNAGNASWLTKEVWGDVEEFDYKEDRVVEVAKAEDESDLSVTPGPRESIALRPMTAAEP